MAQNEKPVALVTGAARGIGRGIAGRLMAAGWNVLIADMRKHDGVKATAELNDGPEGHTGRAEFVLCDVTDEGQVAAAVAKAGDEFGRLDGLVNNAGLAKAKHAPVEDLTLSEWNRWITTNLTGPFLFSKHAAGLLQRAPEGGAIVNISSTRALQAEKNGEAYGASKAGLLGLTRALAISLGPAVRVNAICPGWIDTRAAKESAAAAKAEKHAQHPAGRVGRPEDIAELTLFLLDGARSGFVTGQALVCDGGMTVKMIYEE